MVYTIIWKGRRRKKSHKRFQIRSHQRVGEPEKKVRDTKVEHLIHKVGHLIHTSLLEREVCIKYIRDVE